MKGADLRKETKERVSTSSRKNNINFKNFRWENLHRWFIRQGSCKTANQTSWWKGETINHMWKCRTTNLWWFTGSIKGQVLHIYEHISKFGENLLKSYYIERQVCSSSFEDLLRSIGTGHPSYIQILWVLQHVLLCLLSQNMQRSSIAGVEVDH
jgi:hypothetical protein